MTVLTPAYNAERLIIRLLDSILAQTYPFIHAIIVNDGSTDCTSEVVRSYVPRFESRGYSISLIEQDNGGVSNAINNGLKYVDGEYLVWPDSDDWYSSPNAIEKLVGALQMYGDDVAVSRCAYNRVSEEDMKLVRVDYPKMGEKPLNCFESAAFGGPDFWFEPGGWMIKTKFLDELIPNREIYQSRRTGQNTQLLWPFLFKKKCIALEEVLFTYLIRKNSHSRGALESIDEKLLQQDEYFMTYRAVLNGLRGITDEYKNNILANRKSEVLFQKVVLCMDAHLYSKMWNFNFMFVSQCHQYKIAYLKKELHLMKMLIKGLIYSIISKK